MPRTAPITATELPAAISAIQAKFSEPGKPALTGVEIAELIGSEQPPLPPAGTKYRLKDRTHPEREAIVVASPDGTFEDAVRMYNAIELTKKEPSVRTAKQLIIERIDDKTAA